MTSPQQPQPPPPPPASRAAQGDEEDAVRAAFRLFDTDGSGTLDKSEFRAVLASMAEEAGAFGVAPQVPLASTVTGGVATVISSIPPLNPAN